MPTVNEQLEDGYTNNAVDIQQYAEGLVLALVAILNRADSELSAALLTALDQVPADQFTVERLNAALGSVRGINQTAYESVASELQRELRDFSGYQSDWEYALLLGLLPPILRVNKVSADSGYAQAESTPMQGRLLRDWLAVAASDRITRIINTVRQMSMDGAKPAEIATAVRGTRANKYADGILQKSRTELAVLIKTAVGHVAETFRNMFADSNSELVKAVKWVSVLDSRTTPYCRLRDGLLYTAVAHRPIAHKVPWLQGPGAIHFGCRSTSTLIIKSYRELGIDANRLTPQQRSELSGETPKDSGYAEWLAKQSAARQDQILGKERGMLYRNGDLSFSRMYSSNGQWLTLDELRARLRG